MIATFLCLLGVSLALWLIPSAWNAYWRRTEYIANLERELVALRWKLAQVKLERDMAIVGSNMAGLAIAQRKRRLYLIPGNYNGPQAG